MNIVMFESMGIFKYFDQSIITFINPFLVTNNIEEECGGDSSKNDNKNISYYRLNEKFNDDNPEIKLNDFSVIIQYHYVNFDDLNLFSRDNYDTEEFIIPSDFIPTPNSGDVAVEVQDKFKYGFKTSTCNILNNVVYLMTRNQYGIKGSIYMNHHVKKLFFVDKYQSITLLNSEGMLFTFLYWKSTN